MSTVPIINVRSVSRDGIQTHTPGRQMAVFMDRDGVFNEIHGSIRTPEQLDDRFLPGAIDAVVRLSKETDAKIFIFSNQGQQWIPQAEQEAVMQHLARRVEERGGRIDAIYMCTNDKKWEPPAGEVNGRKPEPGMILQAARDYGPAIDLADCYVIGDMTTDIAAGENADRDVTSILLETGYAGKDGRANIPPDHVSANLPEAVDWIIGRSR